MAIPCVSIIMPVYNGEQHMVNAIRSVQAQTFADWELIVVNDHSEDGTGGLLEQIAGEDTRIQVHTNDRNYGTAKSRNVGLAQSRGVYIAFLDSDDLWHPEKLEKQLACFRDTGADMVYTSYAIVDEAGNKCCRDILVPPAVCFEDILKQNLICCSTVMLKVDVMQGLKFTEEFYHEDYVLWLHLLHSGCKPVGMEQVLVYYMYHGDSKTGNKYRAAVERWRVYRQYLRFSILKSLWYFGQYAHAGIRKYQRL